MICRATHTPAGLFDWFVVDNFAGGGGASLGIERAIGRAVDVAINHNHKAVCMHRANHPHTAHLCQDVFAANPRELVPAGRRLAIWLSPDCTHHSKAKGGKPIRTPQTRSRDLSWVAIKWAGTVAPDVMFLENVEEFQGWGPLKARRCKQTGRVMKFDGTVAAPGEVVPLDDQLLEPRRRLKGRAFHIFVRRLRDHGYQVDWRELRGCDFGTPTIRKRLFMVARRDGLPITWPAPTHGPQEGGQPYRTAAECIDWTIDCPSIFTRKRPLVGNTCKRIAKGIVKHVIEAAEPFIVSVNHGGDDDRTKPLNKPLSTLTQKLGEAFVSPTLIQTGYGERPGQSPRVPGLDKPLGTVVGTGKHAVAAAWMVKHFGGVVGAPINQPAPTQTTIGTQNQLAAAHLTHLRGTNKAGGPIDVPAPAIAAQGQHHGLVSALLAKYYGADQHGQSLREALHTIPTRERFGLVQLAIEHGGTDTLPVGFWRVWNFLIEHLGPDAPAPLVVIGGEIWLITDIGMRMLVPRELYRCMGFPESYIIDHGIDEHGQRIELSKTDAVRLCGNSVAVEVVEALVRANLTHQLQEVIHAN